MAKKQKITHEDFCAIKARAPLEISEREASQLVDDAALALARRCHGQRAGYAWSGGKDSLVLGLIAERAGITSCVLGTCDLEYPAFLRWVDEHGPPGLVVHKVAGIDHTWLQQHPEMLFPSDSRLGAIWYRSVQHKAQAAYFKSAKLDTLLLGRRLQDGNFCGPAEHGYSYVTKGVRRVMPIATWTHAQVFAVLHYFQVPLPPFYGWPRGFRAGTHPWARRACKTVEQGWREIAEIDLSIVETAARFLPSARKHLATGL